MWKEVTNIIMLFIMYDVFLVHSYMCDKTEVYDSQSKASIPSQ